MAEKVDRRIRKTKAQLRRGLARLMQEKSINEITVKELVDEVDINRSTFYLHYTDIYQMLQKIEEEVMEEIVQVMEVCPIDHSDRDSVINFIARFFSILDSNKELFLAFLGPKGDMAFVEKVENLLAARILAPVSADSLNSGTDAAHAYAFVLNGCVGMIRSWLSSPAQETPEHMAKLTYSLIHDIFQKYMGCCNGLGRVYILQQNLSCGNFLQQDLSCKKKGNLSCIFHRCCKKNLQQVLCFGIFS